MNRQIAFPVHGRTSMRALVAVIIATVIVSFGSPAAAQTGDKLSPELRRVIESPAYKDGHWGLLVTDLASGETIYQLAPTTPRITGSTAKTFSVSAALDALGADHRFETPVVRTGNLSPGGELTGDLILAASGDLTFGGRLKPDGTLDIPDFDHGDANALPGFATLTPESPLVALDDLAHQVTASGVKRIRGDVVIDDRLWVPFRVGPLPITPIVVNDNLIDLSTTPAQEGGAATVEWRPQTAMYQVDAQVTTVAAGGTPKIEVTTPAPHQILVRGTIPVGTKPFVQTVQVEDPEAFARTLFIEALGRAGVAVDAPLLGVNPGGKLPTQQAVAQAPRVGQFASVPFSQIAKLINKVSHNLGADMMPALLAAHNGQRTIAEGMELERAFARMAGIDPSLFTLVDGQGDSVENKVAPQAQVQLLRYLTSRPYFQVFYDSTPIIGVDGSLANVIPADNPAVGHIHAKTGTVVSEDAQNKLVLDTKALAGYIDTKGGRRLAFALYLNDIPIVEVQDVLAANSALGEMAAAIYAAQ
jgi:D-alanyl-D-alanine carboxypeptidase/D-alanyl-D-alanine-endopeptidase (penicillin-binding protein 4)